MGYILRRLWVFPVALIGCARTPTTINFREAETEAKPSLLAEADRQHDFGAVIARPERKMDHRYRLVNGTPHDIKIIDVINRKTCCGIVRAKPGVLAPGAGTDVEVTLVVGGRFGEVVHETDVVTDLPTDSSIVLRTTAEAIPPIRVDDLSNAERMVLIGAIEPRRAEYRVFASGTSAEPPVDLDRVELRSTLKVDWVGPKEESPSDDGLRVESRRFVALLDQAGPPGEHRAALQLQSGDEILDRRDVSWEVVSHLTASPRMIVLKPGQERLRVVIESRDHRPFRLTRIECKTAGILHRAENTTSALTQTVEFHGDQQIASKRGAVTFFTDHPAQGRLDVPFVVLD